MKKANPELTDCSHRLETILNIIPDFLFQFDRQGNLLWYHGSQNTLPMCKTEGIIGENLDKLFDNQHAGEFYSAIQQTLNSGKCEMQFEILAGTEIKYFAATFSKLNEHEVIVLVRDHTLLKKSAKELAEKNLKDRLLTEDTTGVVWIFNPGQNRFTYMSPTVVQLRGFTAEEAILQGIHETFASESAAKFERFITHESKEFVRNPDFKKIYRHEYRQRCRDGRMKWVESISRFQYASNGEPELLGMSRNFEYRKQSTRKDYCDEVKDLNGSTVNDQEFLQGKRILVVEDDKFNQLLIRNFLKQLNIETVTAEDGQEAIDILQAETFDLVLMDIEMPVMDGYTATKIIRTEFRSDIPVIAVSASINIGTIRKIIDSGMTDYVLKPFDPDYLCSKIVKRLHQRIRRSQTGEGGSVLNATEQKKFSDTARLRQAVGNNAGQLKTLIIKFLEITPRYYKEVLDAYESKDYALMRQASHKIKSSVDLLASKNMVNNIKLINQYTADKNGHIRLDILIEYFRHSFPSLCEELRNEISSLPD